MVAVKFSLFPYHPVFVLVCDVAGRAIVDATRVGRVTRIMTSGDAMLQRRRQLLLMLG